MSIYLQDDDENEGIEVFCPYCGNPLLFPPDTTVPLTFAPDVTKLFLFPKKCLRSSIPLQKLRKNRR